MKTVDRLAQLLPGAAGEILARRDELREVRLRAGGPVQLVFGAQDCLTGEALEARDLARCLSELMDHSLYAREGELAEGFFTLPDGARVGVCGRLIAEGGRVAGMGDVGSLCVRIARAIPGCAGALLPLAEGPKSLLVASAPGMGKTTCLRDLARLLSSRGLRVAIADERHELAACFRGVPQLDVGPRTDVMDGGPKVASIGRILRAMAPQAIVTDEIGGPEDAQCLAEAARCGVAVIASAHGASIEDLLARPALRKTLDEGVFDTVALLGGSPGALRAVYRREKGAGEWSCG